MQFKKHICTVKRIGKKVFTADFAKRVGKKVTVAGLSAGGAIAGGFLEKPAGAVVGGITAGEVGHTINQEY